VLPKTLRGRSKPQRARSRGGSPTETLHRTKKGWGEGVRTERSKNTKGGRNSKHGKTKKKRWETKSDIQRKSGNPRLIQRKEGPNNADYRTGDTREKGFEGPPIFHKNVQHTSPTTKKKIRDHVSYH